MMMMRAPLSRLLEVTYAVMRIVVGLLFMMQGASKLFGVFGGQVVPLASRFGIAGIIEVTVGVLVMLGFLAGIAAFIGSGEMAFAYFLAHAPQGGWPIQNRGELAVLFCFIFLYMSARGAGIWSVDEGLLGHEGRTRVPVPGT